MVNRNKSVIRLLKAFSAFALLSASLPAMAFVEGQWNFIPTLNLHNTISSSVRPNQTISIMDGPKYTYFLVHQRTYLDQRNGKHTFAKSQTPIPILYRVDNSLSQSPDRPAEMIPVGSIPGTSGFVVDNANYFPETGILVAAYENGLIDIIKDSGEIINCSDFQRMLFPGIETSVTTVSFSHDGSKVWLAGTFGVAELNPETGKITNLLVTDTPIEQAIRVDDSMALLVDGKVLVAPISEAWRNFSAYSPIEYDMSTCQFSYSTVQATQDSWKGYLYKADGEMYNCKSMAQLNDRTAIFNICNNEGSSLSSLAVSRNLDNNWSFLQYDYYWVTYEAINAYYNIRYSSNLGYSKDRFCIGKSTSGAYIDRSVVPDYSVANPANTYRSKAMKTVNLQREYDENKKDLYTPPANTGQHFSSYDCENFWFFVPFHGWLRRHYDAKSNTWTDLTGYTLPNYSTLPLTPNMEYVPGRGMVMSQYGWTSFVKNESWREVALLSYRKDGKWVDYSLPKVTKEVSTGLVNPDGLAVDPNNPDHFYTGSRFCGLVRRNFSDPSDVLFMGADNEQSLNARLPGFVEAFPTQKNWPQFCCVESPGFDSEGNLWFTYNQFDDRTVGIGIWDAKDVSAAKDANTSPSSFHPFTMTTIDIDSYGVNNLTVCKYPSNKSLAVLSNNFDDSPLFVLKRKDDNSIESYPIGGDLVDDFGGKIHIQQTNVLFEDPNNGRMWVGYMEGLFWFSPSELLAGNKVVHRVSLKSDNGVHKEATSFSAVSVYDINIDEFGRIWVATEGAGLFCLDSEGSKILAHYYSANSPLEYDNVYGVAWDADTHSLLASTEGGLFEYTPYEFLAPSAIDQVRVWPSVVEPDYRGYVTFTGVPASMKLSLAGSDGVTIELPSSKNGVIQWDATDSLGNRIPSDSYRVLSAEGKQLGTLIVY